MALGWLSILKAVPWTDVVSNAPKVADGAKKLWEAVGRKSAAAKAGAANPDDTSADALANSGLEVRVAELTAEVLQLQKEMADSSQLIKALAEQNTQLIRRVYWLSRGLFVVGIAAAAGLLLIVLR